MRQMSQKSKKTPKFDQNKNLMILKLLSLVTEFKKDVAEIRNDMGIHVSGFEWNNEDMWCWASQKKIDYYQKVEHENEEEGVIYFGIGSKTDEDVRKTFPANDFENKMLYLGSKYKLPFNFYAFPTVGLARFVLSGEIIAPGQNYYTDFHEAGDKTIWISLVAYAPLSKKELGEAVQQLGQSMGVVTALLEETGRFINKRYRDNIERDLTLLSEQTSRFEKPKKVEHFKVGSYLDLINNSKSVSAKKMSKLKRQHTKDLVVDYSVPTSNQIGKKLGVSGDATRQAKRRLNSLVKELFGFDTES